MTLEDYIKVNQSKYAVIASDVFDSDSVAQSVSDSPRRFLIEETEYVVLSLNPTAIEGLVQYVLSTGAGAEYEFVKGSGNVSLLTHDQALELLATVDNGNNY